MALAAKPALRPRLLAGLFLLAMCLPEVPALAQGDSLELRLRRTFGYSGGSEIQGSFLMIAEGPDDLREVAFFVDETLLETVDVPPFQARLHTGDYPTGPHRLRAEGTLSDGSALSSNVIEVDFVEASASGRAALRMLAPILAIVGLAIAASLAFIAVSSRRYRPGVYGTSGGAICPRCGLPMGRHFLSPNLGVGKKLERCPHCGKWSRVSRAGAAELAEAEARLLSEGASQATAETEADALRRQVDESRFVE